MREIRRPDSLEVTTHPSGGLIVTWGHGTRLKAFETDSEELVAALLGFDSTGSFEAFEKYLEERAGLTSEEARDVASFLLAEAFGDEPAPSNGAVLWDTFGWSDAASVFRATFDTRWVHDYRGNPIAMVRDAMGQNVGAPTEPPLAPWKLYEGPELALPAPKPLDRHFSEVMESRRTRRRFRTGTTTLVDVATIARWTLQRQQNDPSRFVSHTYINDGPCVGYFIFDRNATEIELSAFGPAADHRFVATVYDAERHILRLVSVSDDVEQWADLLWTQRYGEGAGFALVLAVDVRNYLRKYPIARSYNWSASDTGSFMHTAIIVATGLGLGAFQTPAMDDARMCDMLQVDPSEIHPYYIAMFGR